MNERINELFKYVKLNERIEQLAKESGCSIDKLGYGEGNLEKFAELIVKECGQVLESYDPDFDWATVALKKHFGIK